MKTLAKIALLTLISSGAALAQNNITVQGEKKLNVDFKKYKTYSWMQTGQQSNKVIAYTYSEIVDPAAVAPTEKARVKAEKREMKRMKEGKPAEKIVYSYSFIVPAEDSVINNAAINSTDEELQGRGFRMDQASPDLLVAYKIFDRSSKIKGYNTAPLTVESKEVRQPQDTMTYALKPGTVLISLIDAKTSDVVWEGYASGVAQTNDLINDKLRVKEAVNLIFKKFEYRADKLSMNN